MRVFTPCVFLSDYNITERIMQFTTAIAPNQAEVKILLHALAEVI